MHVTIVFSVPAINWSSLAYYIVFSCFFLILIFDARFLSQKVTYVSKAAVDLSILFKSEYSEVLLLLVVMCTQFHYLERFYYSDVSHRFRHHLLGPARIKKAVFIKKMIILTMQKS